MRNRSWLVADLVAVALLLAFCVAIAGSRWRAGIDWGDEGFLAYGAVRVMSGQVPHRDFVSLQPPLSFYTTAAVFKLCGTSLIVLRKFGLLFYGCLPLLVYAISRRLTGSLVSLAAAAPLCLLGMPAFYFVPFAVWQGITLTCLAAWLYLRALSRDGRLLALLAGFLTTCSLFLRHDQAAYLILALLIFTGLLRLAPEESRPERIGWIFICWLGGVVAAAIPILVYCALTGALTEMWRQLVIFPITTYAKTSSLPMPNPMSELTFAGKMAALLFYLPPAIIFLMTVWVLQRVGRGRFARAEAITSFALVWSALFFCQALTRSDFYHVAITLPPFLILSAWGWQAFLNACGERTAIKMAFSLMAIAISAFYVWTLVPVALPDLGTTREVIDLPRGGTETSNGKWLTDFVRGVDERVPPDRSILALPYQPLLYFLCERRNPTRWNYLWPRDQTPEDHAALIEEARRDPPAVVFLTGESEMEGYAPEILDYVRQDFHRAGDFGRLTIYFPNTPNY